FGVRPRRASPLPLRKRARVRGPGREACCYVAPNGPDPTSGAPPCVLPPLGVRKDARLPTGFGEKRSRASPKLERILNLASSKLPDRPSGGPSGLTGARQVSWLAAYRRRRLPRRDAQWRRCVGTPLTVAGPAAVRRNACRVPFSPSFVARDRAVFMFQLRWGLSNARRENRGPRLIDLNASDPVCS